MTKILPIWLYGGVHLGRLRLDVYSAHVSKTTREHYYTKSKRRSGGNWQYLHLLNQLFIEINEKKYVPPQPDHRKNFHIPGSWRETINGRNFILCDNGLDNTILIFGTLDIFSKMCDATILFMDGTFKSVPKIFLQL